MKKKKSRCERERIKRQMAADDVRAARAKARRIGRYVYTEDEAKAINM